MQNSGVTVRTGKYLQVLYLNDYMPGQQYDAHQCLIQLLQKFYSEVNDDCIFKMPLLQSIMCEGTCRHSTENTFSCTELGLKVEVSVNTETIGLLEKSQNPVLLESYWCDKYGNVGTTRKADLVTHKINKIPRSIKSLLIWIFKKIWVFEDPGNFITLFIIKVDMKKVGTTPVA